MALPSQIDLRIVYPDRLLVHEQVDEVQIPGSQGYFGVLPGHTPLLAALTAGELWYRKGQEKSYLAVAFGFAEVLPDRVTILAKAAERAEDIDVARAEASRQRAEERLNQPRSDLDAERARVALMKALVRLQVSSRIGVGARTGALKRLNPQG
jgi:F-type H+-transporting ATPase subunit epsilon